MNDNTRSESHATVAASSTPMKAAHWREISRRQWRSGLAAWLGWLFDGLDMHLYTLVALPLVMELVHAASQSDPAVQEKSAYIQAAFLAGWAIGGGFFGRLGDLLGRSRALALTILTYAFCTGLCAFAHTWWQLLIFRFFAALGIGGEWAVGASLLVETWPRAWRPWIAAVLQSAVNIGILAASAVVGLLATLPHPPPERMVFLIGVLPALFVFWVRRRVPEPEIWEKAAEVSARKPEVRALFRSGMAATTLWVSLVCALSLSAWWLFLFWHPQHMRRLLADGGMHAAEITQRISAAFFLMIAVSVVGNFAAGWIAKRIGNRRAIQVMFFGLFAGMVGAFVVPREFSELAWFWVPLVGFFSGVFGLFTMYLPPLFPILLRTTGSGFCFNIGRLAAAVAAIIFGWTAPVDNMRVALLLTSLLALAAMFCAGGLPDDAAEITAVASDRPARLAQP
jgi:MFS family permease